MTAITAPTPPARPGTGAVPVPRQVVLRWPDLPDAARAAWEQAPQRPAGPRDARDPAGSRVPG